MQVIYKGRHTNGVFVVVPGGEVFAEHDGDPVEVPDAIGEQLLAEQPDAFTQIPKTKPAKAGRAEEAK